MTLTTEDLGEFQDVDSGTLDEILLTESFGKFAILAEADERFIQTGSDWQPNEETSEFLRRHESDPWVLQRREDGWQFQAAVHVTLGQVRKAFQSYLAGGTEWRSAFAWNELNL